MDKIELRDGIGGGITPHGDPSKNMYAARILNYNQVDSHGTSWAPGVFEEDLRTSLPKSVWSHDPRRPIGKVVGYNDDGTGLDVIVQYANLDAVPDARMAHSLQMDGIIDEYSFAFVRQADEPCPNGGERRITKAKIREVSPVLVASGVGTGTIGVRSDASLTRADADDLLRRVALGEITAQTALQELSSKREAPAVEVRWVGEWSEADVEGLRNRLALNDVEDIADTEGRVIGFRSYHGAESPAFEKEQPQHQGEPDADIDAELRAMSDLEAEEY